MHLTHHEFKPDIWNSVEANTFNSSILVLNFKVKLAEVDWTLPNVQVQS